MEKKNFGLFSADFQFRAEGKKVTSRADLKILQLEPARLGLITSMYCSQKLGEDFAKFLWPSQNI